MCVSFPAVYGARTHIIPAGDILGVYKVRLEDNDRPETLEITSEGLVRRGEGEDGTEWVQIIPLTAVTDRTGARVWSSWRRRWDGFQVDYVVEGEYWTLYWKVDNPSEIVAELDSQVRKLPEHLRRYSPDPSTS